MLLQPGDEGAAMGMTRRHRLIRDDHRDQLFLLGRRRGAEGVVIQCRDEAAIAARDADMPGIALLNVQLARMRRVAVAGHDGRELREEPRVVELDRGRLAGDEDRAVARAVDHGLAQ